MNTKYDNALIQRVVEEYRKGQSVALLCAEHNIPRSTIYFWIKQSQKLKSQSGTDLSYQDYYNLKRKYNKLEEKLEVIKATECSLSAPLQEKLAALEKLYGQYSVHVLCEALEVSRGTFYNHIFRRTENKWYEIRREEIKEQIKVAFDESKQRFGSKKIHAVLLEQGVKTSPGYIADLMSEMGLQSVGRHSKKDYQKRITSKKRQNRLQQQFDVSEPNRVWVSDTTQFKVKDKRYYICVIIDLFSRKVVAHSISQKHSTYLITTTLKRALENRNYPQQLMFHSDQGTQYTSKTFRNRLSVNNIVQSFSRSGRPHDNAVAEAFFSLLKRHELYRVDFKSEREFYDSVNNYIVFYNTKQPHGSLGYKTPERFEALYEERQNK